MPAAIRDVGRDGVDPVEWIEQALGRAGTGIGRCRDPQQAVMAADAVGRKRGAGDVAKPAVVSMIIQRELKRASSDLPYL